ncbi:MAG: PspA/IM30 family protein [Armatimonadetes bacterium]|nr:PspA/IM30 family protein [Armatimonadota bacterium]
MKRFWNWLKALFNRGMDKLEDPDIMLDQAKRDMQQALVSNREKAVQAITQRNRLQNMMEEAEKKAQTLESQATMALKQGKRDLALQLMREKMNSDATVTTLRESYEQANVTVEQVKLAIKRQEEEVRKKTAEALALKAQWKQAQIQSSISKALEGLTFENQFEGFGAAQEKIREKQAEASARQEMLGTSISGKLLELEDSTKDAAAEEELAKLEARLGAGATMAEATAGTVQVADGGAPAPVAPTLDAAQEATLQSEAARQLEELEKRLGN